jgi:Domain of unknown function (DUF4976)
VRTDRYKFVRWINRARDGELDELYDLKEDPYELDNRIRSRAMLGVKARMRREMRRLVGEALGV